MEEVKLLPQSVDGVIDVVHGGGHCYIITEDGIFVYYKQNEAFVYKLFVSEQNIQQVSAMDKQLFVSTIAGTKVYEDGHIIFYNDEQTFSVITESDRFYFVQGNTVFSMQSGQRIPELQLNFAQVPVQLLRAQGLFFILACATLYCYNQIFTTFAPQYFSVSPIYVVCYNCDIRVIKINSNDFASLNSTARQISPPERILYIEYSGVGEVFWMLCDTGIYRFDADSLEIRRFIEVAGACKLFVRERLYVYTESGYLLAADAKLVLK